MADYAFLSDCEHSCLIAPDGSVEWLCLPRPDSPSVFGALLDRSAGTFRFGPTNAAAPHNRRYVPGTMVVETTWHTASGWLVVEDLLVMRRTEDQGRRTDYRRAPADSTAAGVLLRRARCISGTVEVEAACVPLFNYGAATGHWEYQGDGYHAPTVKAPDGGLELSVESSLR
ncbi:MAG TPA: trehalase-like domain-containing protein, partial [Acidimicrobiales bacterium]|nr:trehalase-like domain-containing protein [Acidimicrobiales bacterium]